LQSVQANETLSSYPEPGVVALESTAWMAAAPERLPSRTLPSAAWIRAGRPAGRIARGARRSTVWLAVFVNLLVPAVLAAQLRSSEAQPLGSGLPDLRLAPAPNGDLSSSSSLQTAAALLANGLDLSLLGGVPSGELQQESLPLGLLGALDRALEHNLGPLLAQQRLVLDEASRRAARSALLPALSAALERRHDEFNFEASAFSRFRPPGDSASSVLGFDIFDARLNARWTLFDRSAQQELRAARALEGAAQAGLREMRSSLILVAGNLYYRVALLEERTRALEVRVIEASEFSSMSREGLAQGLSTSTEVRAAQLHELAARRDREISFGELEKARLRLARALGLPLGQSFHLLDRVRYTPLQPLDLSTATELALQQRGDVEALRLEVRAARAELAAAKGQRFGQLALEADVGEIGPNIDQRRTTYGVAALMRVPLTRGGEMAARRQEATARLRIAQLSLQALEAQVHYQLAEGLIDERTADSAVNLARRATELAGLQLQEANARFGAGVAPSSEVLAAQTDLALARDRELEALLAHRTAKGSIARALGLDEMQILEILRAEITQFRSSADGRENPAPEEPR
jgi:outer membrane protein TolC